MSEPINAMVIDLSHWDPASDYGAVAADGIVGVIYKATQGTGMTDDTYVDQQQAAKAAGLKWGAYHFGDGGDVERQVENFLGFACPDPDELFCLDWEDNGGDCMDADMAREWITKVEDALQRPGECVIYSGNTAKEALGNDVDDFFGSRRLWLCQYSSTPEIQESWDSYWLWQFTDGQDGPSPHSIKGVGSCDINSYDGNADDLVAEWASGAPQPGPKPHPTEMVDIEITTSGQVKVTVTVNGIRQSPDS